MPDTTLNAHYPGSTASLLLPDDCVNGVKVVLSGLEYGVPVEFAGGPLRILDIGANVGGFAVWARQRWPGCEIECYEPHPKTFGYLERNVTFAGLHRAAVVGADGPAELELRTGVNLLCSSSVLVDSTTDEAVVVPTVRARDLGQASVWKVDCEGNEVEIFADADLGGALVVMYEFHVARDRRRLDMIMRDSGLLLYSETVYCPDLGVCRWIRQQ